MLPRVICAAVRDNNGEVFTGSYHGDAIDMALRSNAVPIPNYRSEVWDVRFMEGFLDEEMNFLTREEAAHRAGVLGQLPKGYRTEPEGLHAVDLTRKPELIYNLLKAA